MPINTPTQALLEIRYGGKPFQSILTDLFHEGKTTEEACKILGISRATMWFWLKCEGTSIKDLRAGITTHPDEEPAEVA